MKNKFILILVSIVSMLLFVTGCENSVANISTSSSSDKKTVIATTYSVYDWAKFIAEGTDNLEIKYLVDSNVDLHSYQPSAEDIVAYKSADLVLCIGGESEEWLEDIGLDDSKVCSLMDVVDKREEEIIEGMQIEEEGGEDEEEGPEYDEHIWLSLKNAEKCVKEISDRFSALDISNGLMYQNNCNEYVSELILLDKQYEDVVKASACHTLLFGDRFPFRYMVDDYGLDYYAAFIGCSAESEANFETIAFLAKKIDELGLNAVCVISSDHDIANSIISTTESKNQEIVEFDSMQSISNKEADSKSYIDIMKNNLNSLKEALEG